MTSRCLLLGVDGGGSSTEAWLASADGEVLGQGVGGPSNAKAVGPEAARHALETAIAGAFADAGESRARVEVACLGLAGFDRPSDRALLALWNDDGQWARRLATQNDGALVIAAGTPEGWGVGVIAGTGSIATARAPDGRTARAGGWGHLIGDEGSAYRLSLDALSLVARRHDGRESRPALGDPLTERLAAALGVSEPGEIVTALYAPEFTRARIAALAPEVLMACASAPADSDRLLVPAGRSLAELAAVAARALGRRAGPLPIALAGGFMLASATVRAALLAELRIHGYEPAHQLVPEPVKGAIVIARRMLVSEHPGHLS